VTTAKQNICKELCSPKYFDMLLIPFDNIFNLAIIINLKSTYFYTLMSIMTIRTLVVFHDVK